MRKRIHFYQNNKNNKLARAINTFIYNIIFITVID